MSYMPSTCVHQVPIGRCPLCPVTIGSRRRVRWWHFVHRDPSWMLIGHYGYHQCRCGARLVRLMHAGVGYPPAPGWPRLVDRHGQRTVSSGWVKAPPEGWSSTGYPEGPFRVRR